MSQLLLPMITPGVTHINQLVSVHCDEKTNVWTYFIGSNPLYRHTKDDRRQFRMITAQLIESGMCRQVNIINTFSVSKSSVIRAQNKYRAGGFEAFFEKSPGRRKGTILTPEVLVEAQGFLDSGLSRNDVADRLEISRDVVRKALEDGRLKKKQLTKPSEATSKSQRSQVDASVGVDGMGTACTRPVERTLAAVGPNEGGCAKSRFELCEDVSYGGVLCAIPALIENGLLAGVETILGKVKGYYTAAQVLLLVAFMSLCRIKTTEKLRGYTPGEFGKLLGLDRIPEARCLRAKLSHLSAGDAGEKWAAHLSKLWMDDLPEYAGTLYIDGHVRVYNGKLSKLPKKYLSRQRLCLRGVTGYWVNDIIGRPFFVIEKATAPGLLKTIENDILPKLLSDVPNQPSEYELEQNPHSYRFILVFDREGYSPEFFKKMWNKYRVACITYRKYVKDEWPQQWFTPVEATMPNGEQITMELAEQGSLIGTGENAMWMREVRKLTDSGHQTSLVSTAYDLPHDRLAVSMFSRWCQENFFKYMMEHFAIDMLQEYGTDSVPDTEMAVNPKWRELNNRRNSVQNKLRHRLGKFGKLNLTADQMKDNQKWIAQRAALFEEIEHFEHELEILKSEIKKTPNKIDWYDLPEEDKYFPLLPGRKRLVDAIKMIAYRAETAMALHMRTDTVDMAATRRILQDLFRTDADILPKEDDKILLIRIHSASRPAANRSLCTLIELLNSYEMIYPGTEMKTVYELIGAQ